MAPQADRPVARTARLLTLLAPGLGHLYLRATWRAFFVALPLIFLTYVMLLGLTAAGSRLPNLALFYGWYLVCYQVGAQLDLGRVLEQPVPAVRPLGSVLLALVLVFALPMGAGAWRLFQQRAGVFVNGDDNLYPVLRRDEIVLYRRHALHERGDLVVFEHAGQARAARIVGVPGDRVRHDGPRLEVNGVVLPQRRLGRLDVQAGAPGPTLLAFQERQGEVDYLVFRDPDTTATLQKTEYLDDGRYWVLCDARDAEGCADSRTLGPISDSSLRGAPTHVLWSPLLARLGYAIFPRVNLSAEAAP